MNGFYDTRLDILLRGLGVETLIITGAWTNMSIEHTARHAADAGYRAVVASDGTSTVNDEWQHAALNYAMQNVASVATCAEIAAALGADAAFVDCRRVSTTVDLPLLELAVRLGRDVRGRESRRRARRSREVPRMGEAETRRALARRRGSAARVALAAREGPRADPAPAGPT